jgi:hypothetical protein
MENPILAPAQFKTPQEEISFLREKVAEKERALSEQNFNIERDQVVADQLSRYQSLPKEQVLHENFVLPKSEEEAIVLNLAPEEHDDKISELVGIMKEKGLKNALSVLSALKDPHLEDDFHRFLVQYIKKGYKAKDFKQSDMAFRGVDMILYELVLPEDKLGEEKKPLREIISSMEQFFSGMLSVSAKSDDKNYIVLEIANSNGSDQFVFYIAVPKNFRDLFEKQMISVFHNARLSEVSNDYNVFNEQGVLYASTSNSRESSGIFSDHCTCNNPHNDDTTDHHSNAKDIIAKRSSFSIIFYIK